MKRFYIGLLIVVFLLVSFTGCGKKAKVEPVDKSPAVEQVDEKTPRIEKPTLTEEEIFQRQSIEELNKTGDLKKIHFDFDRYNIREDMKGNLHKNADWLLKRASVLIIIEGHCDERGTVEYNLALGEKRAEAAKKYLESLGVSADRIKTISYGKNRPAVKGVDENTYFMNRRDEFIITRK